MRFLNYAILVLIIILMVCYPVACEPQEVPQPFTDHLEHCCCSIQDVQTYHKEVLEVLNRIVKRPYFRYFRANLERKCPFWAVNLLCMGNGSPCTVSKCTASDVPSVFNTDCEMGSALPPRSPQDIALDYTVPRSKKAVPWGLDDTSDGSVWADDADRWGAHIDLVRNPESNTYYLGPMANRIWESVYKENCFKQAHEDEMCMEERLFFRLISGLHASISTHLTAFFQPKQPSGWSRNLTEFQRRVGAHPDRKKNLYVLYLFVARSVTKVRELLMQTNFSSGDGVEDALLREEMHSLLYSSKLLCTQTFNETDLVQSEASREYIQEMQAKLLNITRLMDCLTCEKCRLWGKVQTLGLGTAFKIVLSDQASVKSLQRGEIVALINFFRQLSVSIHEVEEMTLALNAEQKCSKNTDQQQSHGEEL